MMPKDFDRRHQGCTEGFSRRNHTGISRENVIGARRADEADSGPMWFKMRSCGSMISRVGARKERLVACRWRHSASTSDIRVAAITAVLGHARERKLIFDVPLARMGPLLYSKPIL